MARGTVLVVEDNEKSLKLACDLLRLHDFEAVPARSGSEALRLAARGCFDLVLMDVQLPDMEGGEALSALRADARTRAVPVVAVTAFAMKGDRERLLSAGFDSYIPKPLDIAAFVREVERLTVGRL
jgi:two-component system cell cycle response regulator DivK